MISESLLTWAILAIAAGLALALAMLAGHGGARLAAEAVYGPRVRRARAALVAAVDRGRLPCERGV